MKARTFRFYGLLEPQGGAGSDYRIWSADAQGVLRVYPYAKSGDSNVVEVFVEATIADSTDGKGTPTVAILDEVEDVIEFDPDTSRPLDERGRRPLAVFDVEVKAITVLDVDIIITGFVGLTPALETTIENAIIADLATIRPFVSSADIEANRNDIVSVSRLIGVVQSVIPDSSFFETLDLEVDGDPVTSFQFLNGDIPFLDTITYV